MNLRFWRNVTLIGGAHVAVIIGLIRWSTESKTPVSQNVTWMSGSIGDKGASPKVASISTPPPDTQSTDESDKEPPLLTAAKSEIQLPAATVTPTPTPRSTSTPRPTPTPNVKVPPKRTPHPKPKPTATPKPAPKKLVVAKASPKPKPTPEKEDVDLTKNEQAPNESPSPSHHPSPTTAATGGGGVGGHGNGPTIQSQFGWYGSMLHDRFYSEWVQPTNVDSATAKNSVLAKLRIEKDGRVSSFEIVRPSGNAAIDDSVRAAAKRVTTVEPLPNGLGADHYDVKIKFELSSD